MSALDIFDKCKTDAGNFGKYRHAEDDYFTRPVLNPIAGRTMKYKDREVIMWSVNNYLGLAENEDIKNSAIEAVKEFSVSSPMGSRMMSGNTKYHIDFEKKLAEYAQKEKAFLFNYGYLGVIGTIASLVQKDDVIVMDKLAHASIVDGVLLSNQTFRVFRHNDMRSLEKLLIRLNKNRKGGIFIVIEGTYGMTGDLAKLDEITYLKEKYNARLFIDDAHGFGVMGKEGRGTADFFGVQDKIDIYFGTFAKSFASIGGFSASQKEVVDWIQYNARTQVFAKSLPMVYVKSLDTTLGYVINGDENRKKMWANSNKLKDGLRELGYYVGKAKSPICPVFVTSEESKMEETATKMLTYLRDHDVFVTVVTYPVIPKGYFMFRMIPTASHIDEDIQKTVEVFKNMREELKLDISIDPDRKRQIDKIYE